MQKQRALIVSPYLDHLGGGERYMLSVASVLEDLGYDITFSWDNMDEINKLATMLGITLKNPKLDPHVMTLYHSQNPLAMYLATKKYDLTVYLSDGSLPMLGSKKNIIHMQVPFHNVGGQNIKNRIKKMFCHSVIVNPNFTKRIVDHEYGINSTVLYPPVELINSTNKKENIILSVGRFEPSLNAKKQDILISAFRLLSPQNPTWKLVLAGGSSSEEWVDHLRELSAGLPIEIVVNATHQQLTDLYKSAKIYWHAAGYGIDEIGCPELTEHFGISTVEAISAGCAPFVVGKGGQTEIVKDPAYYWETPQELADKTEQWIASPRSIPKLNVDYSLQAFSKNLAELIGKI